jgi:hypothetical protein
LTFVFSFLIAVAVAVVGVCRCAGCACRTGTGRIKGLVHDIYRKIASDEATDATQLGKKEDYFS